MAENIVLDRQIAEKSKNTACKIFNAEIRKRTFALNIAANAAAQYLTNKGFPVNTDCSLYKISSFAENIELADIYINDRRLDVRVTFDEKIFYIPKTQYKYDAQPCAYLITKLDPSLDNIQVLGFISSTSLEKQSSANEYYCYETSILKPISELKEFLERTNPQNEVPSPYEIEKIKELAVSFVDNDISESEKVYFLKSVIRYPLCREILCDMNNFDKVANQISKYEELLSDSTLSVLSGNKEEFDEALIANISTVENAEENAEIIAETTATEELLSETLELIESEPEALITEEKAEEHEEILGDSESIEVEDLSVEETEEIIKPMGVISAQENTETAVLELTEEPIEQEPTDSLDTISDDLFETSEELTPDSNNEIENNLEETTINELTLLDENTEIIEEAKTQESETSAVESFDLAEDIEPISFEEDDTPSLISNDDIETNTSSENNNSFDLVEDENDNTLLHDDSDDLLLNDVADLLEETAEEKTEENPVEETVERKPFTLSLEGEEEDDNDDDDNDVMPVTEASVEETPSLNIVEKSNIDIIEEETAPQNTKSEENTDETNNNDSEIQNLLDDDLLALLADDNQEDSSKDTTSSSADINTYTQQTEEQDSFSAFNNTEEEEEEKESIPVGVFENATESEDSETIETLFETDEQNNNGEEKQFELAQEPVSANRVNAVRNVIVMLALFLVIAGVSATAWFMNNHAKQIDNNIVDSSNQDEELFGLQNDAVQPEDQQPALSQDINKSMTNSFSDKPAAITITKLSWQVSEKLAAENSVKEYLQTAGKNIQINLQNDLANSADINFNNNIKVSFEIAPDNTMKGIQVLESSGSDQIDDIVVRSIKNTLKYVSVPKLENFNSDFFLTLIINF